MGLLDKAVSKDINTVITGFQQKNPMFHSIVLQFCAGQEQGLADIAEMTTFHGAVCCSLPQGNALVLLPGDLDMELFSHQLSRSTGSTVLFQFSAHTPSLALEALGPYLL